MGEIGFVGAKARMHADDDVASVDVGERNTGVKYRIASENYRAYLAKILELLKKL